MSKLIACKLAEEACIAPKLLKSWFPMPPVRIIRFICTAHYNIVVHISERFGEFDLVIVGSGPAGLSAAKKALQRGLRVLNLDWGPHDFPHYSALLKSQQVRVTGGQGGTAHYWGGQFGVLSEIDKANWEIVGKLNSKFFQKLEEAERSLCGDIGVDYSDFKTYPLETFSKEIVNQKLRTTVIPKQFGILKMFSQVISDSNYHFVSDMKLVSIEKNTDDFRTLHFEKESLKIGKVPLVVATGCIEATRIIRNSLVLNKESLPKNLGTNLSDHPSIYGSEYKVLKRPKRLPPEVFFENGKRKQEISIYDSEIGRFRSGVFEIRKVIDEIKKNPLEKVFYSSSNLKSIMLILGLCSKLSRRYRTRYLLWYQIEQNRNSESRIKFESDALSSQWSLSDKDFEMFALLKERGELEMMKYDIKKSLQVSIGPESKYSQAFHPSGTMTIGLNPEECAINPYGGVYKIPNTWVASSALFPTGGWINPSLVIMSFGYLVVDDILESKV